MNSAKPDPSAINLRARWAGPLITLALVAAIEMLSRTAFRIPNPPAFLVLSIVFSAFHGGLGPGLVGAFMAWLYLPYFFSDPGHLFQYTQDNLRRVIVWAFALPTIALMVGVLKRRAERAIAAAQTNRLSQAQMAERERAETALRAGEQRYRSLFENMLDGFAYCKMLFDDQDRPLDFVYLNVNDAFERLTGLENVVGKRVTELIPGIKESSPELFEIYSRVALTGRPERFEIDFQPLALWLSISVYSTEKGYFVAVFDNITERKRAEAALAAKNEELRAMTQQLWQTAKLATMGELAASIAHELNNPLGTVSLRVEGLLAQAPPDSPQRRALEVVAREVERMGTLVAGLLHFSRRGARQISTLDVREELEQTLELIHYQLRQRQISVRREFAPAVPLVQADRQQLRQLFLNLFTNASDAMPQGGVLTIRVQGGAGQVVMEIADTGEGIAAEALPQVLEPFFTTKPEGKGTGLGLAICRRILQEHGGTLDLSSDGVGHGASVHLTLPTAASDRAVRAET